ncbi:MAG TPA: ribonuclease HII, partial [Halococcus sp.]|nr:ribonuclease HII [Halococcus sp.]
MQFGVDEAGRGPVLGSMFVACVRADTTSLPDEIDDSKRLSPARREVLAAALHAAEDVSAAVVEVTSAKIDESETNLNTLMVEAAAKVIDRVAENDQSGMVDACDTDTARFGRRVTKKANT